jgi:hypothetical protein
MMRDTDAAKENQLMGIPVYEEISCGSGLARECNA